MSRKQIYIALAVLVLIAAGAGAYFAVFRAAATSPTEAVSGPGYDVIASDRTLGNPKAKVVLIEYAAPICPHCARFNAGVFPQLKKNYIDTGKIYYVFRVFTLAPADGAAEKIARCLPREKYFAFIDRLFRNQPQWDPEYGIQDVHGGLVLMAKNEGMSADQADRCVASTAEDDRINKVGAEAQSRYNINSTPSFVLDGKLQSGPYMSEWTYDDMAKVLDGELAAKS